MNLSETTRSGKAHVRQANDATSVAICLQDICQPAPAQQDVPMQVNYKEQGKLSLSGATVKVEKGLAADSEKEAHALLAEGRADTKAHRYALRMVALLAGGWVSGAGSYWLQGYMQCEAHS